MTVISAIITVVFVAILASESVLGVAFFGEWIRSCFRKHSKA